MLLAGGGAGYLLRCPQLGAVSAVPSENLCPGAGEEPIGRERGAGKASDGRGVMTPVEGRDRFDRTTTAAAVEERAKLRRVFGRSDGLFVTICAIVGLDTIGAVAYSGAQSFTWMVFLGLFFFLPYALLTAELGTAYPDEGGPYVWTRLAFGRLVGAVTSFFYFVGIPIWVGGSLTITAVVVFDEFFVPAEGFWRYALAAVFIWFTVGSAIVSPRIGRWVPTVGAWVRFVLLSFFTLTVVVYAIQNGVRGFGPGDFVPTWGVFVAAAPVLFFNFIGFEVPSNAAEEMRDAQRDVPGMVFRAGALAVTLYAVPVLAILLVLPADQVTRLGGFVDAIKAAFTVYGGEVSADGTATLRGWGDALGTVAALGFIYALATSGSAWLVGVARAQAVACYDGAGPRSLGRFSRRLGTPVNILVVSGLVSTAVMVLAFTLTGGDAGKYFSAVLALSISTATVAYVLIFPSLAALRHADPGAQRPFRVPGGRLGAWLCSVLCTGWALFATVSLVYPGFGTADPDASLPAGFEGQRMEYTLSQVIPLAVLVAVGVLFYILGKPTRRRTSATASENTEAREARST